MQFLIRPVLESDAKSIVDLLNPIVRAGTFTIMPELTVQDQITYQRKLSNPGVFLVAVEEIGQRVVGIQSVEPSYSEAPALRHVGEISTFVRMDCQGQGIGRGLAGAMFPVVAGLGFTKIMAMIRADNPGAIAFYQSLGFRTIGRAENHARVNGHFVDEILTEKLLEAR